MKKPSGERTCFFLMPFSAPFNEYYAQVFKPAAAAAGCKPFRADEMFGAKPFMEDILNSIRSSDVVVVEVTGRNPNVMYEMGVAYAWAKPIVILSQTIEDVPFDLQHYRILIYKTTEPNWPSKLRSGITEAIEEATKKKPQSKGASIQRKKTEQAVSSAAASDITLRQPQRDEEIDKVKNPRDSEAFLKFLETSEQTRETTQRLADLLKGYISLALESLSAREFALLYSHYKLERLGFKPRRDATSSDLPNDVRKVALVRARRRLMSTVERLVRESEQNLGDNEQVIADALLTLIGREVKNKTHR